MPFGNTRQRLLRLVVIQDEFQQEKAKISARFSKSAAKRDIFVRESIQTQVESLRQEFVKRIKEENSIIASDLKQLFTFLTQDLEVTV